MFPSRRFAASAWAPALLVAVIGWFYFWTAMPEWNPAALTRDAGSYYNLLTRGMLRGHLYLDLEADPFLATLRDPSDPVERGPHGLHDVSYYHGRYYLYFGVAPVVLLFLPFRLLTGFFLDESLAAPVFAAAGLIVAVLLLRRVRARYFPAASRLAEAACVVALGLANLVPLLLRRISVWEVPIACGYFCCMAALYALFRALESASPAGWLAGAGTAFGLAVGSRPTYLGASAALAFPLVALARSHGSRWWLDRDWRRAAAAAFGPLAAIGALLALYNYLRFGSPLDFGFRHVMNSEYMATEALFRWRFFWYNFRVYAFAPARFSAFFPFVTFVQLPARPPAYIGAEDPYGLLPNVPFVLLALAAWIGAGRIPGGRPGRLRWFLGAATMVAASTGLMVTAFGGATNRYMVDFAPAVVVLACVGLLWIAGSLLPAGAARAWTGVGVAVLLGYSAAFNVLASLRHNELFHANHPEVYHQVAHAANLLPYEIDRLRHAAYGPVELRVVFPPEKAGAMEPLVVTGCDFLSDYLFVRYLGGDQVQFALEHTSRGTLWGEPLKLTPGGVHTLRIDLGSLYPPADHPYFDRLSPIAARLLQSTVRVTCDGQVSLDRRTRFYDAVSERPSVGTSADRSGFTHPFSGRILARARLADAPLPDAAALQSAAGPLRLELRFPSDRVGQSEPLLCLGVTGRADVVYVRYEDAGHVSFGYDHWSVGGAASPKVAVDYGARQVVEIDCGALHGEAGAAGAPRPLRIRLNGRTVLDQPELYYPCPPDLMAVGMNAIQATTAAEFFTGNLLQVERLPAGPGP